MKVFILFIQYQAYLYSSQKNAQIKAIL